MKRVSSQLAQECSQSRPDGGEGKCVQTQNSISNHLTFKASTRPITYSRGGTLLRQRESPYRRGARCGHLYGTGNQEHHFSFVSQRFDRVQGCSLSRRPESETDVQCRRRSQGNNGSVPAKHKSQACAVADQP